MKKEFSHALIVGTGVFGITALATWWKISPFGFVKTGGVVFLAMYFINVATTSAYFALKAIQGVR